MTTRRRPAMVLPLVLLSAVGTNLSAQRNAPAGAQPPPFTAPNPPTPAAPDAPGQKAVPAQQKPDVGADAPLPSPTGTTLPLRDIAPLSAQPATPDAPSAAATTVRPQSEYGSQAHRFLRFDVYRARNLPPLPPGRLDHLSSLIHDGRLYLSLHDALELAIENNLAVEVSRYNLLAADTDVTRAAGGGTLRSIDTTVTQLPPGVNALTSPLIALQSGVSNPLAANAAVADLSNVTQTGGSTERNLSVNGSAMYSAGPPIPLFDPTLFAQAGYLRRSNTTQLLTTSGTAGAAGSSGSTTSTGPVDFLNAAVDYQQGFSFGTQIDAYADNSPQVLYADTSQFNPFHAPSTSVTVTQPLLRGRGRAVNLRFLRIARLEQKQSELVFEQQVLETVYGISRLYYDLVALGENIGVKELSLATAERLYKDDKDQVDVGTLAPIELTRAKALLASSTLDLIQSRGEYRQQEAILKQQLVRDLGMPTAPILAIVPTDTIHVPDEQPALDIPALISDALAHRPDLAQAGLQIKEDGIAMNASRNAVKPLLNAYANVQTRGSAIVPYVSLGNTGTGAVTPTAALTTGGVRLSTIYQAGVQLNLPLRNRVAQADAARDAINLRQAQGRTIALENEVRQQIENAVIALENAHQSYGAAVESRNYQQQLLQAEVDKFAVGESTNYLILQDESYLAQARSTEVAARGNWMKARISLDRALGNLLETNGIQLDTAVRGTRP